MPSRLWTFSEVFPALSVWRDKNLVETPGRVLHLQQNLVICQPLYDWTKHLVETRRTSSPSPFHKSPSKAALKLKMGSWRSKVRTPPPFPAVPGDDAATVGVFARQLPSPTIRRIICKPSRSSVMQSRLSAAVTITKTNGEDASAPFYKRGGNKNK